MQIFRSSRGTFRVSSPVATLVPGIKQVEVFMEGDRGRPLGKIDVNVDEKRIARPRTPDDADLLKHVMDGVPRLFHS